MKLKILAAIYVFVLAVIVVLADGERTQHVFRFVREMPFGDKTGHFVLMGLFSFVLNLALDARRIRIGRAQILLGTLIVFTLVTLEEFSQLWFITRTFDLIDLLSDFAGILLFGFAADWFAKRKALKI